MPSDDITPAENERNTTGQSDRARREFYSLARKAIAMGQMTAKERDVIARVGHRKQSYWSRHLLDLKALLDERQAR